MKRSLCKVYFKEQVRFSTHTHTHKDEKRINRDWAKKPSIFPIIQGGGNFKFNSLLWSIQRIERGFFTEMYLFWINCECLSPLGKLHKVCFGRILTWMWRGKEGKLGKPRISLGKLLSLSTSLLEIQQNLLTLVELLLRFSHPIFWSKR